MNIVTNENGRIYPSKFLLKNSLLIFLVSGKMGILKWIEALLAESHAFIKGH